MDSMEYRRTTSEIAGYMTNVGDYWNNLKIRMLLAQFLVDPEKVTFCLIQDDESCGGEGRRLTTQLGSDGAGGAGDQY